MRCGHVLDESFLGPMSRPRNRRSEIRNAVAGVESRIKEWSDSNAWYYFINKHIVTSRIFSERPRSTSSTGDSYSRGTPTMFIKISDLEGGGGVVGGQPDKSSHDRVAGSESKTTMFG